MAFLVSAYIARFQESLDEYSDYLYQPAKDKRIKKDREHIIDVHSPSKTSNEPHRPNNLSLRRVR